MKPSLRTMIDSGPIALRGLDRQERKLKLSHLSEKQKNLVNAAAAGVAGVSMGIIAMTLMGAVTPDSNGILSPPHTSENTGNNEIDVIIQCDAPFAECVNDKMNFGDAFNAARTEVGVGGIFEWKGQLYNTFLKEEWDGMNSEEKANFLVSIDEHFLIGDEGKENEIVDILNDINGVYSDYEDIIIIDDDLNNDIVLDSELVEDEIVIFESESDDNELYNDDLGDHISINDNDIRDDFDNDLVIIDDN